MISIIICTYNRDCYIKKTLDCIAACCADKADYEIILVDNNSTDHTAERCREFELERGNELNYRYVVETKQGLSNARNRGIAEAQGEMLVFLDDDAFVAKDYLRNLKKHIEEMPDLAAFGGKIDPYYESGKAPEWMSKWSYTWVSAIDYGKNVTPFKGKAYPIGANMGINAKIAKEAGGFNPNLGRSGKNTMAGEEKDIFNKIRKMGKEIIYFPDVKVEHCIPEKRLTMEFIRSIGDGVGKSEKQRTLDISKLAYIKRLFLEIIKWGGTIALWIIFAFRGEKKKGDVLVMFRKRVTKNLI